MAKSMESRIALRRGARAALLLLGGLLLAACASSAPPAPTAATTRGPEATPAAPIPSEAPKAAPPPVAAVVPAQLAPAAGTPLFFWQVEHPERPGRLFLLGSVHMLQEGYALDPAIQRAFDAADRLAVELDVQAIDAEDSQAVLIAMSTLPAGTTLDQRISAETWSKLVTVLSAEGMDPERLRPFKPWMVAVMLTEIEMARAGFDPQHGVDYTLIRAARDRVPITALETQDLQIRLFDDLPPHLQEVMLAEVLDHMGTQLERVTKTLNAWLAGDTAALEAQLFEDMERHPELLPFYERTFFERNENFAKSLDQLMQREETVFAVIGAGHTVGDRGILALLAGEGFQVRRLRAERSP